VIPQIVVDFLDWQISNIFTTGEAIRTINRKWS